MSMAASQPAYRQSFGFGPVIVMGVSGCGKSSVGAHLAEYLGCPFIEGDSLHPPANIRKMRTGGALDDTDRWPWLDALGEKLAPVRNIVMSCSCLKRSYRDRLRALAAGPLTFVFLQGTRTLLEARLAERKHHFMPPSLLDSQLATLELPQGETDVLTVDIDQPLVRIVGQTFNNLAVRAIHRRQETF